jgi:hypothetical protein
LRIDSSQACSFSIVSDQAQTVPWGRRLCWNESPILLRRGWTIEDEQCQKVRRRV